MGPITKQLKSVTLRSVPAPAWMRPPGRNLKSCKNAEEALLPSRLVFGLDRRKRAGNPAPALGDRIFLRVAVLRRPDAPRDLSADLFHGRRNSEINLTQVKVRFAKTRLSLYRSLV